jgi:hypothetical protein
VDEPRTDLPPYTIEPTLELDGKVANFLILPTPNSASPPKDAERKFKESVEAHLLALLSYQKAYPDYVSRQVDALYKLATAGLATQGRDLQSVERTLSAMESDFIERYVRRYAMRTVIKTIMICFITYVLLFAILRDTKIEYAMDCWISGTQYRIEVRPKPDAPTQITHVPCGESYFRGTIFSISGHFVHAVIGRFRPLYYVLTGLVLGTGFIFITKRAMGADPKTLLRAPLYESVLLHLLVASALAFVLSLFLEVAGVQQISWGAVKMPLGEGQGFLQGAAGVLFGFLAAAGNERITRWLFERIETFKPMS